MLGVWLQKEITEDSSSPKLVDDHAIKREKDGRKYSVVTREYMAQGHDGFLPLKGSKYLMDDEVGQMFSTLVRKYLLVSQISTRCLSTYLTRFDRVLAM